MTDNTEERSESIHCRPGLVDVLKGDPGELGLHSWHDLEDRAREVVAERDALAARVERLSKALVAAVDYINESPCDPDIYQEQWEAYEKYLDSGAQQLRAEAEGGE